MPAIFLTAIRNLRISENLGAGEKFGELRITNDVETIRSLVPISALPLLGRLEANALFDGSAVLFRRFEIHAGMSNQDSLISQIYLVQNFQTALWLDRDEAANVELAYLLCGGRVDSNFLGVQFTNSRGGSEPVILSREELRAVRLSAAKVLNPPAVSARSPTRLTAGSPRLSRALYFVNGARAVDDLGIKIAQYCTAFETLLSTSHTELAHQLSERVSFFLAESPDERVAIYRNLKEAYACRSKVVHGASLSDKQLDGLPMISSRCDGYARALIRMILGDTRLFEAFLSKPEQFDVRISAWLLTATTYAAMSESA